MVWVPWFLLATVVISCAGLGWYVWESGRNQGTSSINLYAQEHEIYARMFSDLPQGAVLPNRIPADAMDIQFSTVRGPMFPDWSITVSYTLPAASVPDELERVRQWFDMPTRGDRISETYSGSRWIMVEFDPETRRFRYDLGTK